MKALVFAAVAVSVLCSGASAQINFDTLTPNSWAQIITTGQYPSWGVETHLAYDTSGHCYMLGACAYGGSAGGTHNNDIFRFNIRTGATTLLYSCGTNPWPGGCQGGQVYDRTRNCIWFGPGNNATCRTNGVLWFPNQAYYGGLYRMACPSGPLEKIRDDGMGGTYYLYDPGNDLVISVRDDNWWGCRLDIYDIRRDTIYTKRSPAPFSQVLGPWRVPCCFDTKRGLVVITRWGGDTSMAARRVWFYNTTTQIWSSKTPPVFPPPMNAPLVYEPLADKYVYIGTLEGSSDEHPQVWTYDYDANTWTQIPRGSRHYDQATPLNSTWPPCRVYPGSFGFDAKNKVIANWGGLNTSGVSMENGGKMPLWTFKLAGGSTGLSGAAPAAKGPSISISPNPFRTHAGIHFKNLKGNGVVKVFSVDGRQAAAFAKSGDAPIAWNAGCLSAGVYLVELAVQGKTFRSRALLVK